MEVKGVVMSSAGVGSLDRSIDESNAWLAGIEEGFGTHDRRFAYRVGRLRRRSRYSPGDLRELLELATAEPPAGGK